MKKRTLVQLAKLYAERPAGGNSTQLAKLVHTIWNKAQNGDRFCIGLLWEMFTLESIGEQEELGVELQRALDRIHNSGEPSGEPEGPD